MIIMKEIKLFKKWDSNVEVKDPGLRRYINLYPRIFPKSRGSYQKYRFYKSKMHIVERLATHLMVPGHYRKKHKITSGHLTSKFYHTLQTIENAFDIIEKKLKKNPLEVFVRAIENAAICEEVTSYQVGSIIARVAVVTSPQRRVDKVLRYFAQGTYQNSFKKKKSVVEALAEEIIYAYKNDKKSFAVREKERIENEAAGAR